MANDPAFLFYPGDYLRDTQCLSEKVQVAYDRIMCEHMRNICVSQQQLNFFTKKLTGAEKDELLHILTKIKGGYEITWVSESIVKRRKYSESRRKNRLKPNKKDVKTYDTHMENEIEKEDESINKNKGAHLFKNSEYFDFEKFKVALAEEEEYGVDLWYYYGSVKDWSASGGKKKKDWIATARNFMRGDKQDNKLVTKKQNKPLTNAQRVHLGLPRIQE